MKKYEVSIDFGNDGFTRHANLYQVMLIIIQNPTATVKVTRI